MAQQQPDVTLDAVLHVAEHLSPLEKLRLIERVAPQIEHDLIAGGRAPGVSLLGLAKDLGPPPSADEIDAARREAWTSFPRADL